MFFYAISTIIFGGMLYNVIKAIREKKYSGLVAILLFIPFFVFFFATVIFGGSAFNDAANSYSLYQQGHYYLYSHGDYTEVSHDVFLKMQIIEIIGHVTWVIGFIWAIVQNKDRLKGNRS